MKFRFLSLLLASALVIPSASVHAQDSSRNYPDHVAKKLDVCPSVRLTSFDFQSAYLEDAASTQRDLKFAWRNDGKKPVVAFELRVLRFNPFDEQLDDSATTFPGHSGANYLPLQPGESGADGLRENTDTELFTALAFVDKVRFADGTIWRASQAAIDAQVKQAVPALAGAAPAKVSSKK